MKNNHNDIWIGVEQLTNDPSYQEIVQKEFVELPIVDQLSEQNAMEVGTNRRDFLKYLGFGLGAATLAAGCERLRWQQVAKFQYAKPFRMS